LFLGIPDMHLRRSGMKAQGQIGNKTTTITQKQLVTRPDPDGNLDIRLDRLTESRALLKQLPSELSPEGSR